MRSSVLFNTRGLCLIVTLLLVLFACVHTGSQPTSLQVVGADAVTALEPSPLIAQYSGIPEPLSLTGFIDLSLLFSGVEEVSIESARQRVLSMVEDFKNQAQDTPDQRSLAESILTYLHDSVFTRYQELQTRVDTVLETGRYNCVSSAVFYAIFAKAVGIQAGAIRTPDHAFCLVHIDDQKFDVETTTRYGFDPGSKKEFADSFGKVTGYAYVPPTNYRERSEVGEKKLLALILYNRVAFAGGLNRHEEALLPAASAYTFLPDPESENLLYMAISNYASWLGMRSRYGEGIAFLDTAINRYPGLPSRADLEKLRRDLTYNYTLTAINRGEFDVAQNTATEMMSAGKLDADTGRELLILVYLKKSESIGRTDYAAASELLLEGIQQFGTDRRMLRGYEVYVHNQAVDLTRSGAHESAREILTRALQNHPGSALLSQDLQKIEAYLKSKQE